MDDPAPVTGEELARNDGREGRPAWVACAGLVYDVTDLFLWKGGRHWALHDAGRDLTEALESAPHGADLLERAVLVGKLTD